MKTFTEHRHKERRHGRKVLLSCMHGTTNLEREGGRERGGERGLNIIIDCMLDISGHKPQTLTSLEQLYYHNESSASTVFDE